VQVTIDTRHDSLEEALAVIRFAACSGDQFISRSARLGGVSASEILMTNQLFAHRRSWDA